jgi:hypothetical protein
MKLPAPIGAIGEHARTALAAARGFSAAIGRAAAAAFQRLQTSWRHPRNGYAPPWTALLIGITGSLAVLVLLLIIMASHAPGQPVSASVAANVAAGREIASSLLIPGEGEWPWPLALEPKSRYTEADAAAIRPDLGAIDVSSLTSRRKAQLESILDAVD